MQTSEISQRSVTRNNTNVARYLTIAAEERPDVVAVLAPVGKRLHGRSPYQPYTFAHVEAWSSALANLFAAYGIGKGSRVLLMVRPGIDLILSVFAMFKMGAVPVVIDPGMGMKPFLDCVRRTQPDALVGVPIAGWIHRFRRSAFCSVKAKIIVNTRKFNQELLGYKGTRFDAVNRAADDLAAILFTSGSTGKAKGVCYEHGMFDAQINMIGEQYGIEAGEIDMPMLPVFALFNPALGMTTVVPDMEPNRPAEIRPKRTLRTIYIYKITNSFGSPVIWEKISRYCEKRNYQVPSFKRIIIAGASASPSLIRRMIKYFPNAEIHTPYGATEALPVSSINGKEIIEDTWEQTEEGKGTCVGRLLPGVQAKIIALNDAPIATLSDCKECEQGQIGEIVVAGPTVTKAYDRLPEATAEAKILDNRAGAEPGKIWHRMGDLGYFDKQGRLWFCGRKVERVELADQTLYTDCIEGVVNTHERIFRSALIGISGKDKQRVPAIVVEPLKKQYPRNRVERERFCKEVIQLLKEKFPKAPIQNVFFRKKFPVDVRHNAKIHRLKLADELGTKMK